MDGEILAVLKEGKNDPKVKGFVITGYGQTFSAGRDIGDFPKVLGDAEASAQYARDSSELLYFMDEMDKPIVAAVNGIALGGGFEVALRCHSMVATKNATFQFPEITLGILPGVGGCVIPYRKWPKSAETFHEMLCLGRAITAQEAASIGMLKKVADNYFDMIKAAIEEVNRLQGKVGRVPDGKVDIPAIKLPEQPMAGKLTLSKEAVSIVAKTIRNGATAISFKDALEIGYRGFGEIACTDAAKEGISAFLEKRQPEFKK
jgi:enoyl-CoA hydratase/3-hydroxyacyl-CoA dehydrogenase